jgi:hypothetical protein
MIFYDPLMQDREAMRTAAQAWRDLSLDEKYTYTERVSNEREIYEKQMATWKKYRDGLKKPPTAYGHFVQVVWNVSQHKPRFVSANWMVSKITLFMGTAKPPKWQDCWSNGPARSRALARSASR